jgi:hypothetical protein
MYRRARASGTAPIGARDGAVDEFDGIAEP